MKSNHKIFTPFFFLAPVSYFTEFMILKSFEQSHSLNAILGGLWTLGQVGIVVTLIYIHKNVLRVGSRWRSIGIVIAIAGATAYSINYIFGYWLNFNTRIFLPLGALLTAVGMTLTGLQVLVQKLMKGAKRFTPLLVGLYPFLVMFPLLMITGHPDLNAILAWGIPWLLLGFGLRQMARLRVEATLGRAKRSPRLS